MDRDNHYETAFAAYLRTRRFDHVAIDETRRSLFADDDLPAKSPDFIVRGAADTRWLVDVKGRRFPGGTVAKARYVWENWVTTDDVGGLERWRSSFGDGYRGLFVFVYELCQEVTLPPGTADTWDWQDRRYLLRGVPVDEYKQHMKVRSPKWGTVNLPRAKFRELVRPVSSFLHPGPEMGPTLAERVAAALGNER